MATTGGGETSVEESLEEARRTLDALIGKIREVDRLAVDLFRINILFAGLPSTGLSLTVRSSRLSAEQFVNACSGFGTTVLWFSALTYTSTSIQLGVSPAFLDNDDGPSRRELVDKHGDWLAHNVRVARVNRCGITLAIITTFASVNFFVAGAVVSILGRRFAALDVELLLLSGVAGVVIWYVQTVYVALTRHLGDENDPQFFSVERAVRALELDAK